MHAKIQKPFGFLFIFLVLVWGCASSDPKTNDKLDGQVVQQGAACNPPVSYNETLTACLPLPSDYQPRDNASANDTWSSCISDDDNYHRIDPNVSTIARIDAFETMSTLLWARSTPPSGQDFIEARVLYAQAEGLDSRVQRRHDIHYPAPANNAGCNTVGIPEQYPDRCVGPQTLLPILNEAFAKGTQGDAPREQAARIEAALLWFLYVSPLSEMTSCSTSAKDCDSAWAYYGGGTSRDEPRGLGRYIQTISPETHHRAFDGILAIRCWRDLDSAATATNTALRDQARLQFDQAAIRGMALILRQRFLELKCSSGDYRSAAFAFIQVLGPLLNRAASERDASLAIVLQNQVSATNPDAVNVEAATSAIDVLFPCP